MKKLSRNHSSNDINYWLKEEVAAMGRNWSCRFLSCSVKDNPNIVSTLNYAFNRYAFNTRNVSILLHIFQLHSNEHLMKQILRLLEPSVATYGKPILLPRYLYLCAGTVRLLIFNGINTVTSRRDRENCEGQNTIPRSHYRPWAQWCIEALNEKAICFELLELLD